MLVELSVIPLARGRSVGADVAELLKIIDAAGLDYRLTAAGTILEGDWDEVMAVVKRCHETMRKRTDRVVTLVKIDDYGGRTGRLSQAVASVEQKAGKPLKK
jgi:uncharacterized protein (TIGR00106 family)